MFRIPEHFHRTIYIGSLILLAISLPYSVFTLSVAQITLTVNWLIEGNLRQKLECLKQRLTVLVISLFYLVHLLGMTYTSNFSWGFHDLRIKLPLLVLPLVIGTSTPLKKQQLKAILNIYLVAVIVGSMYSAYIIFGFDGNSIHRTDQMFPFIWYIRWSLIVNLAIFVMFWLFNNTKSGHKWLYIIAIVWLIVYLFLLHVLTGIVVFVVTSFILLVRSIFYNQQLLYRWFVAVIILIFILIVSAFLTRSYSKFFTFEKINPANIDKFTPKGNQYYHDFTKKDVENGHYTYLYICESELREAWQKRSKLDYDGKTKNMGDLKYVIFRYLTSKGLHKDAEGISHLTDKEIWYIEFGITNYLDTVKYSLYPPIYRAIWQLYNYKNGANPSGYSICQRIEFVKTALHIIRNNFWFGVGTGDEPDAFAQQYITDKSQLAEERRLRTHNQLMTFWVTFGVLGFLITLFSLVMPPVFEKKYTDYLFLTIFIISFLSFLNEDTLETHTGISFVAFFYTIFLFYKDEKT